MDADIAALGAVLSDRSRARILQALSDGRALPASLLAAEAGVAASTASEHLSRLVDAGLVAVHPQGRHRYFRLRDEDVASLLETLARLAPAGEVRSLKDGNRLALLRSARTCYDHLAGRLGVGIFAALLDAGAIVGGDGVHHLDGAAEDRLSAAGRDLAYRLTAAGRDRLVELGLELPHADDDGTTPLRYCVDWTEQRHHLSGVVGRALTARLFALGWIERGGYARSVRLSDEGRAGLRRALGVTLD
ncbi:MAG TPA: winged helix-turn-helix domain-containing protein [Gaiellaceae bacterium]|nr:winged helix-turn-helix domain-containing protein [Gaiellaceae bacterium]